jgi:hypothetical protein
MPPSLARRTFLGLLAGSLVSKRADAEDAPAGYTTRPFAHGGIELDVLTRGDKSDPLVFVLHDMAGLRRECFELGDTLVDKKFFVALPRFFGGAGLGYLKACEFRSKFRCYDLDDYGPIMPWIKGLARQRQRELWRDRQLHDGHSAVVDVEERPVRRVGVVSAGVSVQLVLRRQGVSIEDPPVIVKILSHLGLPFRAPPRAPARRVDLFQTI